MAHPPEILISSPDVKPDRDEIEKVHLRMTMPDHGDVFVRQVGWGAEFSVPESVSVVGLKGTDRVWEAWVLPHNRAQSIQSDQSNFTAGEWRPATWARQKCGDMVSPEWAPTDLFWHPTVGFYVGKEGTETAKRLAAFRGVLEEDPVKVAELSVEAEPEDEPEAGLPPAPAPKPAAPPRPPSRPQAAAPAK